MKRHTQGWCLVGDPVLNGKHCLTSHVNQAFSLVMLDLCLQVEAMYRQHSGMLKEDRYLTEARENILANVAWLARNSAPACAWLQARNL